MAKGNGQGPPYQISSIGHVDKNIRRFQRQASRQGRGEQFLTALKYIYQQLQNDPHALGDPVYRLSSLRLQIYICSLRPLVMYYAVHEDRPLVFITDVKLMAG